MIAAAPWWDHLTWPQAVMGSALAVALVLVAVIFKMGDDE